MSSVDLDEMKEMYRYAAYSTHINDDDLSSPKIDVNWVNVDDDNKTLLIHAIELNGAASESDKIKIVNLLLKHGALVDAKDINGRTALWWAVHKNYPQIVEILVKNNAAITDHIADYVIANGNNITDAHEMIKKLAREAAKKGGRKSRKSKRSKRFRRNRRTKRR